ncbi:MAG TPA: hypothetical protein VHD87_15220 [Acidimicrobiales bacterium]|nr:hypothetical protein [Acidimicrobiales bacterium]
MTDDDGSVDAAIRRLHDLAAEADALADATPGELVPTRDQSPESVKRRLAAQRSAATRKAAEIARIKHEIEARVRVELDAAYGALAPLQKQIARLEEGIHAVNLYLGRDEEIVELRGGDRAPADTPITLRQMVLAMDEECAVAADAGGIDARSIDAFDAWLLSDPSHLDQVLPEPKGVVVLVPRATLRDYGDPWINEQRNAENRQSYWLLRNGDTVLRMATDFQVGARLVAARDEFTAFFTDRRYNHTTGEYETITLAPGTAQWLRAEESAEARKRHFMKVALILEGLLHRTTVFHPLPAPAASFINPDSYDAGYVRIVTDAELALGTGREPFHDWLARLNAQLTPGMRIVGNFACEEFRHANSDFQERRYAHSRLWPNTAPPPASGELLTLDRRNPDGGLVARYARTDKRYGYEHGDWGDYGQWEYKTRASITVRASDKFILPFDLVDVETMRAYLDARAERHAYASMFPVLQAAIAAKQAEADAEAPFRVMLAGVLATACGVDVEDAAAAVPALVDWFKLANRYHRPLVDPDPALQPKAVRLITAEYRRRLADAAAPTGADAFADQLAEQYPDHLLVARKRDGKYVVVVAHGDGPFVTRHTVTRRAGHTVSDEWVLLDPRWRRWTILHTTPTWETWDHAATLADHVSAPELAATVADLRARFANDEEGAPVAITFSNRRGDARKFSVYLDGFTFRSNQVFSGDTVEFDTARQLTKWRNRPDTRVRELRWRRGPRNILVLEGQWSRLASWGGHFDPIQPPWTNRYADTLLWVDDDRAAALMDRHDQFTRIETAREALRTTAHRAARSIQDAWAANAEADAYARFLEDYADPDLWEGHRKTLRISYPHHGRVHDALLHAIERLVESDQPVAGLTAQGAVDAAAAMDQGRRLELPVDIAELVITLDQEDESDAD